MSIPTPCKLLSWSWDRVLPAGLAGHAVAVVVVAWVEGAVTSAWHSPVDRSGSNRHQCPFPGGDTTASSASAPPSPAGEPSLDVDAAIVQAAALRRILSAARTAPAAAAPRPPRPASPRGNPTPSSTAITNRPRPRPRTRQRRSGILPSSDPATTCRSATPECAQTATPRTGTASSYPSRRRRRRDSCRNPAPCGDAASSAS